jgi:BASS family bile acid:Na+ symporter
MSSTDQSSTPDQSLPSSFEGMSNTELAVVRTDLASDRTQMATQRTAMSTKRTGLAVERTDLAETRTDLAEARTELARERTRAAEERTLMAWMRTSLSMISFGFGIDRFFNYLNATNAPAQTNQLSEERLIGLSLIALGIVALVGALIGHWRTLRSLEEREYQYSPGNSLGFTIGVVLLFIGLAAFIPLIVGEVQLGEIFSVTNPALQTLAGLVVFVIMLTMGIMLVPERLLNLFRHPSLLVRSLISVLIVYPLIVTAVLLLLDVSPRSSVALIILASAPAAPLLTKRAKMAGADVSMAASLQVLLAISAVVVTPLLLSVFAAPFPQARQSIEFLTVAQQIATVQLLPLGLGILIRRLSADLADEISGLMLTVANTMFLVLAFFLVAISINLVPQFSLTSLVAFAVVVVLGLLLGHLLGGPKPEQQAAVATATIARNAGLALFIAIANNQPATVPSIVAYLIVGAVVATPYNVWIKLPMKPQSEPTADELSAPATTVIAEN